MNVQEQAVTTIATVADSAREHFVKFYPVFMPPLKLILISAREKHMRLLRGKTMECISLIGLAVGKEIVRFGAACCSWFTYVCQVTAALSTEMDARRVMSSLAVCVGRRRGHDGAAGRAAVHRDR
jgi:hypothetical protein